MSSNTVYRPDPDKDFYVVWSDNTDMPMAWGTRTEVAGHLLDFKRQEMEYELQREPERIEERLDRTAERGTSSLIGRAPREGIRYGGYGTVPMDKVEEFLASWSGEEDKFDETVVVPWGND